MKKRILIPGASVFYVRTIEQVRDLGYEVHAIDRNPQAPGLKVADRFSVIDIMDRQAVLDYAKVNNIDGIMPVNDFGTRAAFYAAQKLGLISPSYLSGICGNDKGIMRDVWAHDGLPQPNYVVFEHDKARRLMSYIIEKVGFPLIVKPTDVGGAGRGISIARDSEELRQSIEYASTAFRSNRRLIAEQFIEGIEVTVESLAWRGQVYPMAISDKVKPVSRYRVATSLNFPAAFDDETNDRIRSLTIRASEALGIANGATHTELIVQHDGRIVLVEIGIRGGGGHIFSTIVKEVTGINAPQELAKILCGDKPELTMHPFTGCVYRFFNPVGRGVIASIYYDVNLIKSGFVVDFGITARPGDRFDGLNDSMKRVGFVVTRGRDRAEAIAHADRIESSVRFVFRDD